MRKLKADEIECRVSQVSAKGCSLLLYKTARVDRAILDEEFGTMSWQNDFKLIDGKMYGGIGVYSNDLSEWIWKWDCGIESREDEEGNEKKGEASDSFKRAGFRWSIGRALYTSPFIWIGADKANIKPGKNGKPTCYDKFIVEKIAYSEDGRRIVGVSIINETKRERAFVWQAK